jgi:hypothetical protein
MDKIHAVKPETNALIGETATLLVYSTPSLASAHQIEPGKV